MPNPRDEDDALDKAIRKQEEQAASRKQARAQQAQSNRDQEIKTEPSKPNPADSTKKVQAHVIDENKRAIEMQKALRKNRIEIQLEALKVNLENLKRSPVMQPDTIKSEDAKSIIDAQLYHQKATAAYNNIPHEFIQEDPKARLAKAALCINHAINIMVDDFNDRVDRLTNKSKEKTLLAETLISDPTTTQGKIDELIATLKARIPLQKTAKGLYEAMDKNIQNQLSEAFAKLNQHENMITNAISQLTEKLSEFNIATREPDPLLKQETIRAEGFDPPTQYVQTQQAEIPLQPIQQTIPYQENPVNEPIDDKSSVEQQPTIPIEHDNRKATPIDSSLKTATSKDNIADEAPDEDIEISAGTAAPTQADKAIDTALTNLAGRPESLDSTLQTTKESAAEATAVMELQKKQAKVQATQEIARMLIDNLPANIDNIHLTTSYINLDKVSDFQVPTSFAQEILPHLPQGSTLEDAKDIAHELHPQIMLCNREILTAIKSNNEVLCMMELSALKEKLSQATSNGLTTLATQTTKVDGHSTPLQAITVDIEQFKLKIATAVFNPSFLNEITREIDQTLAEKTQQLAIAYQTHNTAILQKEAAETAKLNTSNKLAITPITDKETHIINLSNGSQGTISVKNTNDPSVKNAEASSSSKANAICYSSTVSRGNIPELTTADRQLVAIGIYNKFVSKNPDVKTPLEINGKNISIHLLETLFRSCQADGRPMRIIEGAVINLGNTQGKITRSGNSWSPGPADAALLNEIEQYMKNPLKNVDAKKSVNNTLTSLAANATPFATNKDYSTQSELVKLAKDIDVLGSYMEREKIGTPDQRRNLTINPRKPLPTLVTTPHNNNAQQPESKQPSHPHKP